MPKENEKIQWHPAFAAAMDLELAQNRDDIITEKEYNLNNQPLRIDLLIIKKRKDAIIENEIGRFFRGHNIMEYKSHDDSLSIDNVYKTMAYAGLYKAYGKTVDEIKADDITVSLVRQGKPNKLFKYFKEHGDRVSNPCKGIYYIEGRYPFPMQIIVIKELDSTAHIWMKALSDRLEEEEMRRLIKETRLLTGKQDRESAGSVMTVSTAANRETVEKIRRGGGSMYEVLMEIMKPEIQQKEKEARDIGMREGIRGAVDILYDMGCSDNEIMEKIMRKYSLSIEEAKGYL